MQSPFPLASSRPQELFRKLWDSIQEMFRRLKHQISEPRTSAPGAISPSGQDPSPAWTCQCVCTMCVMVIANCCYRILHLLRLADVNRCVRGAGRKGSTGQGCSCRAAVHRSLAVTAWSDKPVASVALSEKGLAINSTFQRARSIAWDLLPVHLCQALTHPLLSVLLSIAHLA
jgi:hypothetical protein